MTFDELVQAVAKKGFTERQARFLTTVMLQTGVDEAVGCVGGIGNVCAFQPPLVANDTIPNGRGGHADIRPGQDQLRLGLNKESHG